MFGEGVCAPLRWRVFAYAPLNRCWDRILILNLSLGLKESWACHYRGSSVLRVVDGGLGCVSCARASRPPTAFRSLSLVYK